MTSRFIAACLACAAFATLAPASEAQPARRAPAAKDAPREVAIVAAGCFWGVERWMTVDGVVDVDVGYAGGTSDKATYEQVSAGDTGRAEAVRIVFDPSVVSYEDLLLRFYRIHDPTTKDRQGNDRGTQYRSAIFPTTDAQRKTAERITARVEKSGQWKAPITTTIEPPTHWVKAEDYHQDYLVKHPGGYDNHYLRDLKF